MLYARKTSLRIIPALFLFILICSVGATEIKTNTTNMRSNHTNTLDDGIPMPDWHIDSDGYLVFNITNGFEFDLYNVSYDIKFGGGVFIFKVNSKTDAFTDYHPSGETITVKSNDPIVKPWLIVGRPVYFGTYLLTADITIDGMYYGQSWCNIAGILIFIIVLESGFTPGN